MAPTDLGARPPEVTNPEEEYMFLDLVFYHKVLLVIFNILEEKCRQHSSQTCCRR
jgi:hypothetical protein